MKKILLGIFMFLGTIGFAQEGEDIEKYFKNVSKMVKEANADGYVELPEIFINISREEIEREQTMNILRRRILRVYPYVVATSENLMALNSELDKKSTTREKNKYIKTQEKLLKEKFEEPLKKLSRKDGQILVKLIHRQTGQSTFNLIKEFKSGWSAFWSNQTAKMFNINLKTQFNPNQNIEDFYIEYLLEELANQRRIHYVTPVLQFNRAKMKADWKTKLGDSGYYPE